MSGSYLSIRSVPVCKRQQRPSQRAQERQRERMAVATLLSFPTPYQNVFSQNLCTTNNNNRWLHGLSSSTTSISFRYPHKSIIIPPPSSSTSVVEPDASPPVQPETTNDVSGELPLAGGCRACGRKEIEKGCNGEGRIQGGIATVPGFGWWPIKAYRPCPGFLASGGRYRRQGQSMDEVAFGGGENRTPVEANTKEELARSKKI
uniref:Uncharacterized protein LOC105124247 n=1 Tax=Rhizophora mucronata TaxID=61149 RepID=A0A2P2IZ00_RHIMU